MVEIIDPRPGMSVYDPTCGSAGMLLEAGMGVGADVRSVIERLLANPDVVYLHVHNAMHGCYSARVDRA